MSRIVARRPSHLNATSKSCVFMEWQPSCWKALAAQWCWTMREQRAESGPTQTVSIALLLSVLWLERMVSSELRSCPFSHVYASNSAAWFSFCLKSLVFFGCSAPADVMSHEQHKRFVMKIVKKFARRSSQATDNYCFLLLMFLLSTKCFNG